MSGETASLIVEFKSAGAETVKREAEAVKVAAIKSARESAAVFVQAYKERDQLAIEWMQRLKERDAALLIQQKQAGASARAELKAQHARELADLKANQAEKIAAAKAAALAERRELAATRIAERQAAAERKAEAREIERARIAAAREAARQERASAASSSKGFKVGIGAVAGQGFSVGGIASVNPYAAAGVAAAYMVKNVATDLVREATVWEKFKVALTDIEGSAAKAKETTNDLYELAKRPGIGLKEAEQTYIQFRALSMEGEKAQKVIKAVSNAVALSGGGAVEFQRVNYQITQMLSKGKVLEEDLRIMRNSLPRLTVAMREAFGTTTAEGIRKAGVNAEQFLDKIVTQFEKLPTASQTLESTLENASTAISRFKASFVPTDEVKSSLNFFTSTVESLTKLNDAMTKAAGNSFWAKFALLTSGPVGGALLVGKTAVDALADNRIPQAAKNAAGKSVARARDEYGFSAEQIGNMYRPESSSFNQAGASFAAYQASLLASKKAEVVANAAILLENQKLGIALSNNSAYEKARLTLAAEYAYKIGEAKTEEDKIALAKQRGLQFALLAKKNREDEAAALRNVVMETDKLVLQNSKLDQYTKSRMQIERDFEKPMQDAQGNEALLAALQTQKDARLKGVDKQEAEALDAIVVATEKLLRQNSKLKDFALERVEIQEEYRRKIEEAANAELQAALVRQRDAELALVQKREDEKKTESGKALSLQFAPEGDKLAIEYEKNRQLIVDATFKTGEERNRVMKALNDQYVRDQAQMLAQSAMTVTSAGQSLFGDLASSYKMGVDYRYDLEKAAINKTLSLTGLEGAARVAQQQKRDDALQSLDEKRQAQMEGTYMTMFMISKGFALAESVLKLNLAIAQAAASGPFPANLAAMAAVAASVGSVVSNIAAINYAGAYDKGGDIPAGQVGMVGENGLEFVQGPAHVTSTKDTAKLLAGAGTAPVVNVMNYSGQNVQVQQGTDPGTIDIIVGEVAKRVEGQLATGIRSGRGEVQSAIKETYALTRSGY